MKFRAIAKPLAAAALLLTATACNRNAVEAINLSNEGDKMVKLNPAQAVSKYEQATKLDPSNHRIFYKLALAHEKQKNWDKVAEAMAQAARLRPKNAKYHYKRGKALARLSKKPAEWESAKAPLQNCIKNDANYHECYYELGEVMLQTDDEQRALENWTKAVQHNPQELIYYVPLAELYVNLGLYDQASAVVKEGMKFAKPGKNGRFNLHQLMAMVYQAKGDAKASIAELEKANALPEAKRHPELLFNLGGAYATMNPPNKRKAKQMLKGFAARGCRGSKAKRYRAQCKQAQAMLAKLLSTRIY